MSSIDELVEGGIELRKSRPITRGYVVAAACSKHP